MAGNLDLNVKITADAEKLKKGMADAVNIVRGGTDKIKSYAFASKKALEEAMGGQSLIAKRRAFSESIRQTRSDLVGMKNELDRLQQKLSNTAKWDIETQKKLQAQILSTKSALRETETEIKNFQDGQADLNFTIQDGSRKAEQNTQAMEALSRAVNAGAMATLLLSGNNDKLSKVMRGVQAVMALASAGVALYNLAQRQNEIYTAAATVAQKAYAIAVGTSTGAMKAFRIALVTSGVGAILVGLGFLIEAFMNLGDEVEDTTGKISDFQKKQEELALSKVRWENEKLILSLRKRGATEEEIQNQILENAKAEQQVINDLIKARFKNGQSLEDLNDLRNQVGKEYRRSELEADVKLEDDKRAAREKAAAEYKKWLEDKKKLEEEMTSNLTKFLIDEEVKRVKEQNKARDMTEADLMPASVTQPGVKAPDVLPGVGSFMDIATQNQEAVNVDLDAIEQFRKNTYQQGLLTQIRANQAEKFAERMRIAAEQISQAFSQMAVEVGAAFGVLLSDAILGKVSGLDAFVQTFANSLSNFLNTFGRALLAQAFAIEAFKESLENLDPVIAFAAGVGLITAAALVKNTMGNGIKAFADGGIVSGPTLGLMGEYPGAQSNPEVIAPLDKLQSMINTGQGGNFVAQTKFDGRDLWLAVNRYEKDKARG
jgi:hypothetical protein